jgi:hypothetical protein
MELRESVRLFAEAMETKLRENDHDRDGRECEVTWLLERGREEHKKLWQAATDRSSRIDTAEDVLREAADVANLAMMVADVCGGLRRDQ